MIPLYYPNRSSLQRLGVDGKEKEKGKKTMPSRLHRRTNKSKEMDKRKTHENDVLMRRDKAQVDRWKEKRKRQR